MIKIRNIRKSMNKKQIRKPQNTYNKNINIIVNFALFHNQVYSVLA